MGCWNNTCSLSGLPIREYDKVNFVIIANRPSMPTASGFCYSDGYAIPVSFVMTGEYDDYGGVKEVEDDLASKLFLKWFSEGVKDGSLTVVDDDYYKLNTDATIEQILTVFERDLVTYNTELYSKDISVNVGINMWHKSIFDKSTTHSYLMFTLRAFRWLTSQSLSTHSAINYLGLFLTFYMFKS